MEFFVLKSSSLMKYIFTLDPRSWIELQKGDFIAVVIWSKNIFKHFKNCIMSLIICCGFHIVLPCQTVFGCQ